MPSVHNRRAAVCTNVATCEVAAAGQSLEWYPGAGEYCPECGEALSSPESVFAPNASASSGPVRDSPAENGSAPGALPQNGSNYRTPDRAGTMRGHAAPDKLTDGAAERSAPGTPPGRPAATPAHGSAETGKRVPIDWPQVLRERKVRAARPLRWFWLVVVAVIAVAAGVVYAERRPIGAEKRTASDAIVVCPVASAQQLATDLVRAYAAKSGTGPDRFALGSGDLCDVRFTTASTAPDDVIARDGIVAIVNPLNPISRISEKQLRAIFSGSIHDWLQIGGSRGPIVPVMPVDSSDEAQTLASSLFFGGAVDRSVRRVHTSADVTRWVTGADARSRRSIGLVAFSQAVPAKVVPLAYLPPPSVLSIGTRHYPYTLSIAVETASNRADSAAVHFAEFARSTDAAAIVAKNGLVNREGL